MLFANSNSMSIDHRVGYDSLFRKHILTGIESKCCEGIMPPSWIVKVMEGWGERKNVAGKSAGTINSNPALQAMGMNWNLYTVQDDNVNQNFAVTNMENAIDAIKKWMVNDAK